MITAHKDLVAGVIAALVAAGVVVGYISALSYICRYSIDAGVLRIRMFGFKVREVQLSNIKKIQLINCLDTVPFSKTFQPNFLLAQRWGGYKAKEIVLEMRRGIFKKVIISPSDPDAFVRLLDAERGNLLSG